MLDIRVRISFYDLLDFKPRRTEIKRHFVRAEEEEINTHFLAPPLIQVDGVVTDVECQQQHSARSENSPQFTQCLDHVASWNVNDGVERDNARPALRIDGERHHIALTEFDAGVQQGGKNKSAFQMRIVQLYASQQKFTEANALADRIVKDDPKNNNAIGMRAALQVNSGDLTKIDAAISDLKTRIKAIDKTLATATAQEHKMAIVTQLRKVPGIGAVTATAVASRLAAKSFAHPDQFVAYIGLDIDVRDSGKKKGTRGLTHQGDAELRRLLYCCAQSSLRATDSPFKAQYDRERAKGLTSTAALCAVARKMAKLCWSLHKHNDVYDPDRVYQAPKRSAEPVSMTQ